MMMFDMYFKYLIDNIKLNVKDNIKSSIEDVEKSVFIT